MHLMKRGLTWEMVEPGYLLVNGWEDTFLVVEKLPLRYLYRLKIWSLTHRALDVFECVSLDDMQDYLTAVHYAAPDA